MGLANLRKAALLDQSVTENSKEMQRVVNLCYNKPLYYSWWPPKHERKYNSAGGQCCLWHILGPERKDGKDMPMLPYQKLLSSTAGTQMYLAQEVSRPWRDYIFPILYCLSLLD